MAKGNMLLGYSRGSVGDVTFYRAGGNQRARARNRKPANPMTVKQQTQRSKFANAVKFYKQVTSNFFRFAYEDKKVNESDYNAFMRHNVVNSGFIGAQASKIASWPALGTWEVSNGSLPSITVSPQPNVDDVHMGFNAFLPITSVVTTVGELSEQLIEDVNYRVGDIITILLYGFKPWEILPTVDTTNPVNAASTYLQFIVNPDDTTALSSITSDLFLARTFSISVRLIEEGIYGLFVDCGRSVMDYGCQCAVIHSRNSDSGLLVSTQSMVASTDTDSSTDIGRVIEKAMEESGTYYNSVLADWDASAEAILQGGGA